MKNKKTHPGRSHDFAKLLLLITRGRSPAVVEPPLTSTLRRLTPRRASAETNNGSKLKLPIYRRGCGGV